MEFDALTSRVAGLEGKCDRLQHENTVLREQLVNHHGIMAKDWEQTLAYEERLRREEAGNAKLSAEAVVLRRVSEQNAEEAEALRLDARRWQALQSSEDLSSFRSSEIDLVLQVALLGAGRLQAEASCRRQTLKLRFNTELEQRLCVVCRDRQKAVLFQPCMHVCVCEVCRGRLRPYRCPICQEPVREHCARVHF